MSKNYGLDCRNPFTGFLNTINQLIGTAETTLFDSSVLPRAEQYVKAQQITDAQFERLGHIYRGLTLVASNERVKSSPEVIKELGDIVTKEIETVRGTLGNSNLSARSYIEKVGAFRLPFEINLNQEQSQMKEELKDVLVHLDKDLSAGRRQSRIQSGTDIESFSYATTLGLSEDKLRVLLLTSDPSHINLFDAFFGLVYSANFQMANVNNRNHNNAAALLGNPSVRITKVDMESNIQPYLIARDTNYPDLLGSGFKWKRYTQTSEGQRKDIVNYVRETISKILALKKKMQEPKASVTKPALEEKVEPAVTEVKPADLTLPQKSELQIDNSALISLYNAIGFEREKVEEKYKDGSIEKIIDGYNSLKTIAKATGATDVLELIREDEEAIASFAVPIFTSNIEQLIKDGKLESTLERQKKVAEVLKRDALLNEGVSTAKTYLEGKVSEYSGKIKSVEERIVSLGSEISSLNEQKIKLEQETKVYTTHLDVVKKYKVPVQTQVVPETTYKKTPEAEPILSEDPVENIYKKMQRVIKQNQIEISLEDNTKVPKFVLKEALGFEHNSKLLNIMKKAKISEEVWPISKGARNFTFTKDMLRRIAPYC